MRGKDLSNIKIFKPVRITPAYAGKSSYGINANALARDHPRLCGEKLAYFDITDISTGSPPPMRGKEQYLIAEGVASRITPAYAGKSYQRRNRRSQVWDHPRLCGEKLLTIKSLVTITGSPPPMRGKVVTGLATIFTTRITPAYAGKSGKKRKDNC